MLQGAPADAIHVAIITVGQARVIAHPAVAASYALFRSSLVSDQQSVHHFIWLSREVAGSSDGGSSEIYELATDKRWAAALEIYEPAVIVRSNKTMKCRRECRLRCSEASLPVGHDAPMNWLRQFFAVHQAYVAARAYGHEHGIDFAWYIKRRPDLLHLQPLPPLRSLSRAAAYVPHGVMTRVPKDQHNNDHMVVCPAGELCDRFFSVYERSYGQCDATFRMRWPWQSLIVTSYQPDALRLFEHAYTIVRAQEERGRPAGPECARLSCSSSPYSTGCVAPHLVPFVPQCTALALQFKAADVSTPQAVLRQLLLAAPPNRPAQHLARRLEAKPERPGGEMRRYAALLASIAPIPCRDDFAALAETRFRQTGKAAEIGVFLGTYAAANLKVWQGEYYAIDAWQWRPTDDPADKNFRNEKDNQKHMKEAMDNMAFAGKRAIPVRAKSLEAVGRFADHTFDWLYIDALHTEKALLDDLRAWWPKLRPGGLFTGDDYGDENATDFMSAERYAKTYGRYGFDRNVAKKHHWGVMRATQRFSREMGVPLMVTWMRDCYNWPA
jgi:hypothetical protein